MYEIGVEVSFRNHTLKKSDLQMVVGDYNAVKLVFTFDEPIPSGGILYFKMSDPKNRMVLNTTISNNQVVLYGKDSQNRDCSLFAMEGLYAFEITLKTSNSQITSAPGWLSVDKQWVNTDGVVVPPEISSEFAALKTQVNALQTQVNSGVLGAVKSVCGKTGIVLLTAEDVGAMSADYVLDTAGVDTEQLVADALAQVTTEALNEAVGEAVDTKIGQYISQSKNIFDVNTVSVTNNTWWGGNGVRQSSTSSKTFSVYAKGNKTYTTKGATNYIIYFDSNGNKISAFTAGLTENTIKTFTTPNGTASLGICVPLNFDLSTFMVVEGDTYPEEYIAPGLIVGGYNLSEIAKQAANGGSGGSSGSDGSDDEPATNLFDVNTVSITNNTWWGGNGVRQSSTSSKTFVLPCTPNTTYSTKGATNYIVFLRTNVTDGSTHISNFTAGLTANVEKTFTTPANANYMGITVPMEQDMTTFVVVKGEHYVVPETPSDTPSGTPSNFTGKKYLIFGDSYTDGTNPDYSNNWTIPFKQEMQPSSFVNKAQHGTGYGPSFYTGMHNGTRVESGITQVESAIADTSINPDVVIFFFGPNESLSYFDENIEQYFSGENGEATAISSFSDSLLFTKTVPAMRYCVEKIMDAYPKAKIFICTHAQTGKAQTVSGWRYADILAKREIQKKVAERMGVEVIDTFNCGLYSRYSSKYFRDGLHPNETGYTLIAKKIMRSVKDWFNAD